MAAPDIPKPSCQGLQSVHSALLIDGQMRGLRRVFMLRVSPARWWFDMTSLSGSKERRERSAWGSEEPVGNLNQLAREGAGESQLRNTSWGVALRAAKNQRVGQRPHG